MEVKIFCACGGKYKFEVEPVDGKLPGPVKCPVCGADGTEKGNAVIAQSLSQGTAAQRPITIPSSAAGSSQAAIPGGSPSTAPVAEVRIPSIQIPAQTSRSSSSTAVPAQTPQSAPVAVTPPPAGPGPIHVSATTGAAETSDPARSSRSGFVTPVVPRSSKQAAASVGAANPASPAAAMPVAPATEPNAALSSGPAPVPAAGALVPKPPAEGVKRLSVSAAHVTSPAPAAAPAPSEAPPTPVPIPQGASAHARQPSRGRENSFTRGLVGIGAASFIGLLIWFGVTLVLSRRIGWIAWGVGAMIGWAGQAMAKEHSRRLGVASALATTVVLILGSIWSARHEATKFADLYMAGYYEEKMEYARGAVKAKTDEELRNFISENGLPQDFEIDFASDSEPPARDFSNPASIDTKVLVDFRKKDLPELRNFAEGKVSRSSFEREKRPAIESALSGAFIMGSAFRFSMLIFIGLGVVSSWKIATAGK